MDSAQQEKQLRALRAHSLALQHACALLIQTTPEAVRQLQLRSEELKLALAKLNTPPDIAQAARALVVSLIDAADQLSHRSTK